MAADEDTPGPGTPDTGPAATPRPVRPPWTSTEGGGGGGAGVRASDGERDVAAGRLRDAFAEGRLDDDEFDRRARAALTARTRADLDSLLADLPAAPHPAGGTGTVAVPAPGRFAVALKGTLRRTGRWRVPDRFTAVVYKGAGLLDLRAAELAGPVTTVVAVAYKSRVTVVVPPTVRVEMTGLGVTHGAEDKTSRAERGENVPPANAPVVVVRGVAYRGSVEVTARPPGDGRSRRDRRLRARERRWERRWEQRMR